MKQTKKVIAMLLALAMVLALGVTAFAQDVDVNNGNGKITIDNATKGSTYTIYKIFDATVSDDNTKIAYTSTKDLDATGRTWFQSRDLGNGKFEITALGTFNENVMKPADPQKPITDPVNATYKTFVDWAKGYGTQVSTTTATDTVINFNKVPLGYYIMTSTHGTGTAVSVTSTQKEITIQDKNYVEPVPKKEVVLNKGQQGEQKVTVNMAAMDPDIPVDFLLSIENTANYKGTDPVYRYEITDALPLGMSYTAGSVVVKVGGETINPVTTGKRYAIEYYNKNNQVTTNVAEAQSFKITLPWTDDNTINGTHLYANGALITVEYKAFIDPTKAKEVPFANNDPYTNKMNSTVFAGNTESKLPEQTTKTYQTTVGLYKHTGTGANKQTLTGAEFTLTRLDGQQVEGTVVTTNGTRFVEDMTGAYWKLKDGSYTKTPPTDPGVSANLYASATQKYREEEFTDVQSSKAGGTEIKAFVDANGKVAFKGLYEGKYKIVESIVPNGYNKAADIIFTLTFDRVKEEWTLTQEGVQQPQPQPLTGKEFTIDVENKPGTTLPGTGGMGTTVFYALGSLLVIGAGVMLFARKRMGQQEN